MKIAVTGTHGLIAQRLVPILEAGGHTVVPLVRGAAGAGQVHWDPEAGDLDPGALTGVDGVVHLAGRSIFTRWTNDRKRRIRDSRVQGTSLIADRLASLDRPPVALVSGSAVGYYGDRGDEVLTEDSGGGTGFLADLCARWESATDAAAAAGVRTVHLRSGIVLDRAGGALHPLLPIFKLGLGAQLGGGDQWTPWVSIDDEVAAIVHALASDDLTGPVNVTAPEPVTNRTYTKVLGRVLGRPTFLAVPAVAIRTALGREMAAEMLLGGQRALPARLEQSGFRFAHRDLEAGLRAVLGR